MLHSVKSIYIITLFFIRACTFGQSLFKRTCNDQNVPMINNQSRYVLNLKKKMYNNENIGLILSKKRTSFIKLSI